MDIETTRVSMRKVAADNRHFNELLDQGQTKTAEGIVNDYVRDVIRQEANVREVFTPMPVENEDLDRVSTTDRPMIIVEKEPDASETFATFVELTSTPKAKWFHGKRYEMYFGKITTPTFKKFKWELMTTRMDLRRVIAENATKNMGDEEDGFYRRTLLQVVNKDASNRRTTAGAFTSNAWKRAKQAFAKRRVPIGKVIMTNSLHYEVMDLPATAVGNNVADEHYRNGEMPEKAVWGIPVIESVKTHVWDTREAFIVSPNEFHGRMYILQDVTMYIKQERDVIEFDSYEALSMSVGNDKTVQHLVFS